MPFSTFVTCNAHTEARVCPCGNTAESEGFVPSTSGGAPVEPYATDAGLTIGLPDPWDGEHYVCLACGAVHSQADPVLNPAGTGPEDAYLLSVVAP